MDVSLTMQHRMCATISRQVNGVFYEDRLEDAPAVQRLNEITRAVMRYNGRFFRKNQ